MTSEELWDVLATGTSTDRLEAARQLGLTSDPGNLSRMVQLRATERDSWVRRALDNSIERLRRSGMPIPATAIWTSEAASSDLDDVRAVVTQKITRTLIHEARPLVTDVILAARRELGQSYETSATFRAANRLNEFLDAIAILSDASKSPAVVEFDLSTMVSDHIEERGYRAKAVVAMRQDPVVVKGDPVLVRLAIDNAIRNAIEASEAGRAPIIVNCGGSEVDAWIVVLDEGAGLPADFPNAFDPGTTTKSKDEHFGLGLAIAGQAMDSLGGTIRLVPREPRGTSCEIRWPQREVVQA